MSKNDAFGAFLTGFFVGGLIGAGVALVMAPQSGEETREQIRQKGIELGKQVSETAEEARKKAEKALEEAKAKLEEATKELEKRAKDLQEQSKELLEEKKISIKLKKGEEEEAAEEGITLEEAAPEGEEA